MNARARYKWGAVLGGCLITGIATAQYAQSPLPSGAKLVNTDTTWVPKQNSWSLRADARLFGSSEKTVYGGLQLDAGVGNGFAVTLRGTAANFKSFDGTGFTIRHGGSDIEALVKYAVPQSNGLMIAAGGSLPNTPAQNKLFGVVEAAYRFPTREADFYLGGKEVFRKEALAGIFGGVDFRVAPGFDVVGDVTVPVTGHNTYSTDTGSLARRVVYGAAVRYSPAGNSKTTPFTVDVGITNGLGATTGFSLTPALGDSVGLFIAVGIRY